MIADYLSRDLERPKMPPEIQTRVSAQGSRWQCDKGSVEQMRWTAVVAGILILLSACSMTVWYSVQSTDGTFTYPLDDTYIGMAIAKNVALHGTWGASREFASAASSPGFILLLSACYLVTGPNVYWPLVLALAASVGCIFAADRLMRQTPRMTRMCAVLAVALLTPLSTMALIGMEHALHILLCLVFLRLSVSLIAGGRPLTWRVLAVVALMVAVRYESLFVAVGTCVLLARQRRWRASITLGIAAWIPVIAFGAYSIAHGGALSPTPFSSREDQRCTRYSRSSAKGRISFH